MSRPLSIHGEVDPKYFRTKSWYIPMKCSEKRRDVLSHIVGSLMVCSDTGDVNLAYNEDVKEGHQIYYMSI